MKCSVSCRFLALIFGCSMLLSVLDAGAQNINEVPRFEVEGYLVKDTIPGSSTDAVPMLSAHTGNVSVEDIARAAADLQADYARRGYPSVSVAVGPQEITNGIVTMHVFVSAVPQIRISGKRYEMSTNGVAEISNLLPPPKTNAVVSALISKPIEPVRPLTPEEEALHQKMVELDLAERRAMLPPQPPLTTQLVLAPTRMALTNDVQKVLRQKMAELNNEASRSQMLPVQTNSVTPATTNSGPVFEVKGFEVTGNTLLASNTIQLVLQTYIGTNVTFDQVRQALTDLQTVYREHGFATVSVTLPQQTLSDKIVRVRVFEGRLEEIQIVHNRYFSSNNVMRALPSLHAGMILNAPVFQDELDRANANQDRQIYPAIEPGFLEGTSLLKLDVHDRLPVHAKTDFNNENSPGTPELRVNSSVEYKNLWQLEHSLGLQYSFSPEKYKSGDQWAWYDKPLVANYSGFYRLPLGNPETVANTISASTRFGYDEATRRFVLPPPSGQAELNFYASRSSIDTGLESTRNQVIFDVPGVREVTKHDVQQDLTVNNAIGAQLTAPLVQDNGVHSTWSASLTYKTYQLTSAKTNEFSFSEITVDANGLPLPPIISTVSSPVPLTKRNLDYLPFTLRYDGSLQDSLGVTVFGVGLTVNPWFSGSKANLTNVTGSAQSTGHWVTLNPTLTRDFYLPRNWTLSLHSEAQWASEPLVSTEQFGAGGVNSVRGYFEGEVFGDKGWRVDLDLKTPPVVAGIAYGKEALTFRGTVFTDYSDVYLIDPQGREASTPLWGAGVGCVISVGSHWESRLLFAVPFDSTSTTEALRPKFNFSLTAQF